FDGLEVLIDGDQIILREDLHPAEKASQLVISSQRGCPFHCTYCLHGVIREMYKGQKYLRRKSVDKFLDEIEYRLKDHRLDELVFWDDVFFMHPSWIEEFCEKYPKRIGLPWGGNCHPLLTSRDILERVKGAGCTFMTIGIQSGSEYIARDIYQRNVTNEQHLAFGRDLRETGHDRLVYDLLSHCPFEREEDLRATVNLLAQLPKALKVTVKHLVLFPFTTITKLDYPKINLPDRLYHFYEMLYLLAEQPGFDPRLLPALMDGPGLRENPDLIEELVRQLASSTEENGSGKADAEKEALAQRVRDLENQMPWGIHRAGKHFLKQIANRLQRR
ncbi:radical SAM protein, partial [bacterium]|nr:radical SAM protein [bacterium]